MASKPRRYLQRNDGTQIPRNIIVFAVETEDIPIEDSCNASVSVLRRWAAKRTRIEQGKMTRVKELVGETADSFWEFVQDSSDGKCRTWCFAYNCAFALTQLHFWELLDEGSYTVRMRPIRNTIRTRVRGRDQIDKVCFSVHPFYVQCRTVGKCLSFIDVANYSQRILPIGGENMEHGFPNVSDSSGTKGDGAHYVIRICEETYRYITGIVIRWDNENCGVFRETAAGLAMQNYQHTSAVTTPNGNSVDILCSPDAKEHKLERQAYFGGRIQCYYVGYAEGDIYKLDCNSLYPYVMREYSYPRKFVRYELKPDISDLRDAIGLYEMVASVLIKSKNNTYPVRIDGGQYHCTGEFWTDLCGQELERAILADDIAVVSQVQYYLKAPLFKEWVGQWEQRKIQSSRHFDNDIEKYELCKLVLNSLSGKWAQKLNGWTTVADEIPVQRWGAYSEYSRKYQRWIECRGIAGMKQIRVDMGEPKHSFPLISACIAANAREYMLQVKSICPGDSIYYSATDSLICDAYAMEALQKAALIHDYEFGKFKVESVHKTCRIIGPNWYELDGVVTASGWYGNAMESDSHDGRVAVFERIDQLIETGPRRDVIVQRREATIPVVSRRGIVDENGIWHPYRITFDPDFSDHLKKESFRPVYFWDRQADRIGAGVDV